MSIAAKVIEGTKRNPYPRLMRHMPTGVVVLFTDYDHGWIVSKPDERTHQPIGHSWNKVKPDNYEEFHGTVELSNDGG